MKKKLLFIIFSLFMFSFSLIWAQNNETSDAINCKTSEVVKQYFDNNPDELIKYQNFNEYTRKFIKNNENRKGLMCGAEYTIPVVFHIYGNVQHGKPVNYNTIVNSLKQVNDDFTGLNDDFDSIDPNFDGIKSTIDIEFKLATIDPDGNTTTGVIFYPEEGGMGNYGSSAVARDNWDNYKYANIYITGDLYNDGESTHSGVAWYPSVNMSDLGIARVVMNGQYLTGNTSQEFASVLSHEFGHFLNLIHTHEGGCNGTDQVNDTPQDTQSNGGGCSETSDCGTLINHENYMGYNGASGCYKMYTVGQISRMTAALTHSTREPLWQPGNLVATGTNTPEPAIPVVTFDVSSGQLSTPDNYDNYQWNLNGVAINGANDPIYTVLENGEYTIEVSNGSDTSCSSISEIKTVETFAVSNFIKNNFMIFPNPVNDNLTIVKNTNINLIDAKVHDINGRLIKVINLTNVVDQRININFSELSSGVYFMNVSSQQGLGAVKIVKK